MDCMSVGHINQYWLQRPPVDDTQLSLTRPLVTWRKWPRHLQMAWAKKKLKVGIHSSGKSLTKIQNLHKSGACIFHVVATQSVFLPAYHAYDILLPQCQPTSELSWQTWLQIQVGAKGMPGCWRTTRCNGKVMGGLSIWNQISTCSVSLIRWSLSESTFWGSHQWKLLMSLFPSAQA